MKPDVFHEEVAVSIRLPLPMSPGEMNRTLRSLGYTLWYDVYSLPRPDAPPHPEWQSDILALVHLYLDQREVDAQETSDSIELRYPLATLDTTMISPFLVALSDLEAAVGGSLWMFGATTTIEAVSRHLSALASELMEELGEEPGSLSLCRMIEASYGR